MSARADGERVRALHALDSLRAAIDATESELRAESRPVSNEAPQTITTCAYVVASALNRLVAYEYAADDVRAPRAQSGGDR